MRIFSEAKIVKGEVRRVLPSNDVELVNAIAVIHNKENVSLDFPYTSYSSGNYIINTAEIFIPHIILSHSDVLSLPTHMQNEIKNKKKKESDANANHN